MSLVCCETLPTTLVSCASGTVERATNLEPTTTFVSRDVTIDVSRAPYRRVCITVSAPITISVGDTGGHNVTLTLYRDSAGAPVEIDSVTLGVYHTSGQDMSVTPILVHQADPGVFHATLTIGPVDGTTVSVPYGRINISAAVTSLLL